MGGTPRERFGLRVGELHVAHPGGAMVPGSGGPGSIAAVKRDGFHGLHLAREESQGADGVVARRDGKAARRGDVSQFASINRIVTLHG